MIYAKMLLNRVYPEIEKHLQLNQKSLRKNRRTTAQILTVTRMKEEVQDKKYHICMDVSHSVW